MTPEQRWIAEYAIALKTIWFQPLRQRDIAYTFRKTAPADLPSLEALHDLAIATLGPLEQERILAARQAIAERLPPEIVAIIINHAFPHPRPADDSFLRFPRIEKNAIAITMPRFNTASPEARYVAARIARVTDALPRRPPASAVIRIEKHTATRAGSGSLYCGTIHASPIATAGRIAQAAGAHHLRLVATGCDDTGTPFHNDTPCTALFKTAQCTPTETLMHTRLTTPFPTNRWHALPARRRFPQIVAVLPSGVVVATLQLAGHAPAHIVKKRKGDAFPHIIKRGHSHMSSQQVAIAAALDTAGI